MTSDLLWFIVSLVLIVAGIIGIRSRKKYQPSTRMRAQDQQAAKMGVSVGAFLTLILGLFILVMDSWTMVPAKNVAVLNVLGNANASVANGPHVVWPWAKVELVDATKQNVNLNADMGQWDKGVCTTIPVRLGNSTTACPDMTLQWNINEGSNISSLWRNYRGTNDNVVANVGTNLVMRHLQSAANQAFEHFDPLKALNDQGNVVVSTTQLGKDIENNLRAALGNDIVIDYVTLGLIHYDAATQNRINAYAQQVADTRIAEQAVQTAVKQAEANAKLAADTNSSNEGVKYQNCLNLIRDLAAKDQLKNLPPAFTCGEGGANVLLSAGRGGVQP